MPTNINQPMEVLTPSNQTFSIHGAASGECGTVVPTGASHTMFKAMSSTMSGAGKLVARVGSTLYAVPLLVNS